MMDDKFSSDLSNFVLDQYIKLCDAYSETFPEMGNVNYSSNVFSLMVSYYIVGIMKNSPDLTNDHHAALFEMFAIQVKNMINTELQINGKDAVNWERGIELLK